MPTGVDYFSTLGYQPAVAVVAAGLISPIATLVLVVVTLAGALPVYRRVARESPHDEGSVAMLERLLSYWWSKLLVLVLLGFAVTDFLITITLSTADATAHIVENPLVGSALHGWEVPLTCALVVLLGVVFLMGFAEAVNIAVVVVATFLLLNLVVVTGALYRVFTEPVVIADWSDALLTQHGNPLIVVAIALVVFPKLALGLSGFETGVAVMPLVKGAEGDTEKHPEGRIAGARKLLTTAALIMSGFLIACHRRPGAHHVGVDRGDPLGPAQGPEGGDGRVRGHCRRLRLHDRGEHDRAPGGPQDRPALRGGDLHRVVRLAGAAQHRAADLRRAPRQDRPPDRP